MKQLRKLFVLLGIATVVALIATQTSAIAASQASIRGKVSAATPVFNVKTYGATGNGSTNDTPAINKAITAANSAGGGIVEFPSGTYKSSNSIHLKSNVTIQLDSGSTVMGSSAKGYDAAESNPFSQYQDYGHSHFHDAMIWGDSLTNIGFTGSGTIDGGGNLIPGTRGAGQADKIISLTRCNGLTLSGITLNRGGHFAVLTNDCTNVVSDHLTISTASDRDGWNVISTTNATITNANISSNDDALVFKSDYALGASLPSGHVTVLNARLSSKCCNALMFGSETCGSFTDYQFQGITITAAGKSGLGMVSMDGADITDVHYKDVTMTGVHSPIMEKIGTRLRCGGSPTVGHISGITYDNVTGTGVSNTAYSPTLWGQSGNHISGVTFTDVNLTVPGGNGTMSTGVPSDNGDYNPNSIGTRPAYGWYIHDADNIHFVSSSVRAASSDGRPAVIVNNGSGVTFNGFTAQTGSSSPYDMGFQTVNGYCVAGSTNTSGGALRINTSGSTQSCSSSGTTRYEAENATLSSGSVVATNHTGFSGTGFVDTANAVGSYVEWTVTVPTAGTYTASIGYANGTTVDRPMDLAVDGSTTASGVSFPGTGSWNTWATHAFTVTLAAGTNTIRSSATTANGCPNLDYLDLG